MLLSSAAPVASSQKEVPLPAPVSNADNEERERMMFKEKFELRKTANLMHNELERCFKYIDEPMPAVLADAQDLRVLRKNIVTDINATLDALSALSAKLN